jgi:Zn-dependent alcohol dehydrogenase
MPVEGFAVVVREQAAPLSVERVTFSDAGKGEVRVKVQAVGVCQSDASFYNGKLPTQLPLVLGHEGSGIVEQVRPWEDDGEEENVLCVVCAV